LIIIPAWYDAQNTDKSRLPIRINPGMAFGTGTHPTTQLSLQLMEKYVQAGDRMIDIGCGSGVLSIAGILLGAIHSIGVDVSGAAILSSQENAALNEVGDNLEIEKGSVPEILAGTFSYQKAPLVVANILLKVLEELFDQGMGELVEEQGTLLISGILVDQIETIQQKARANGFIPLEQIAQDDWAAIALKKQS
jgi:ribosomal protein L11 methyltransferase